MRLEGIDQACRMHLIEECVHVVLDFLALSGKFLLDNIDDFLFVARLLDRLPDGAGDWVQTVDGGKVADAFAHGNDESLAGDDARNDGFRANVARHFQIVFRMQTVSI